MRPSGRILILEYKMSKDGKDVEVSVEVKAPKVQGKFYRAVHGRMVDMETGQEFNDPPVEVKKVTAWMQSQIDAGKIEEA